MELIALDYKFWEESDKYLTEKKFFEEKCLSIVAIFAGSPADGPLIKIIGLSLIQKYINVIQ